MSDTGLGGVTPTTEPTELQLLQQKVDAIQVKLDKLYLQVNPPPPPPPPPPAPVNPSGQPMPTADLPGWKLGWKEDFNTVAEKGEIRAKYGNKMMFYPPDSDTQTYYDTSGRGRYETQNLTVHNSCMEMSAYTTSDGKHHVCCFLPTLATPGTATSGKYGAVPGGRFAVRFKADRIPTYKIAWLLWPVTGVWPKDGEIDFPECGLSGETIKAFMHNQDAVAESAGGLGGSDQVRQVATVNADNWHTSVIEWKMGQSCKFLLDGVALGPTITSRVPNKPMRWTFHLETSLNKSVAIDNAAKGKVYIDWAAYWAPV